MRVLCIHGNGGHPDDFRREVIPLEGELRRFVSYAVEFDYFAMKETPRDIPWTVLKEYVRDSPHWTPFHANDAASMQNSVAALFEHTLANGPYDGVLAFSMGTSLASTAIMLHDQILGGLSTECQPLFKFAVLISGAPSQLVKYLPDLPEDVLLKDHWTQVAKMAASQVSKDWIAGNGKYRQQSTPAHPCHPKVAVSDEFEKPVNDYRIHGISLDLKSLQIISTVHAIGGTDDYFFPASVALFEMCAGMGRAKYVEHQEGHSMPRSATSLRKLASVCAEVMNCVRDDGKSGQSPNPTVQRQKETSLYEWCKQVRYADGVKSNNEPRPVWYGVSHSGWKQTMGHGYGMETEGEEGSWAV